MMRSFSLAAALLFGAAALGAQAPRAGARPATPASAASRAPDVTADSVVTTSHVARIGGADVRYTATTGWLVLRASDGKPRARMFFVAYTRDGEDARTRPLTFSYNGGPGSASMWLHMGFMGPRRAVLAAEGFQPAPPFQLADNADSPLDVTDIVMVDAAGTGYSRVLEGTSTREFYSARGDVEAMADFIRTYLSTYNRWSSPKYLLGESYGTMRSAGVSQVLQQHDIELNGIVLVSSVLDYETKLYAPGNDYPYVNFLPTFAATAWYHKRLAPDLQALPLAQVVDSARAFARHDYLLALQQGNTLSPSAQAAIASRVARFSGLSATYVQQANLRVTDSRFRKELLRDRRLTVGRLDSRYTGLDEDAAGERQEYDPASSATSGAFVSQFNAYLHDALGWTGTDEYLSSGDVRPWDYAPYTNRYLNMVDDLRQTMARNPSLRVLVANGYYDMATPFGATEYTMSHLGFDPTYPERITLRYYDAGHMMYARAESRAKLKADVAAFIRATKGG